MKRKHKRLIRRLSYLMPRWKWLYRGCKMYTDNYRGMSNSDMLINGELALINKLLASKKVVVFDVGANRGQWTEAVLAVSPDANIHCFEPVSSTYQRLLRRGLPPTVVVNQTGLGKAPASMAMHIYGDSAEINSLYANTQRNLIGLEEVQVTTVDTYCQENGIDTVFFLKIDVEGHDLAVLEGASQMLQSGKIEVIQLEYGDNWILSRTFLKDLFELADATGYHIYRIMPFGLMCIQEYSHAYENFQHANYMLLRNPELLPKNLKVIRL